jgi:DNA-binding FadR family transcriptional regulator
VSAIPVREALQLLQSEGLVTTVPHVGATVSPVSRESVAEVFTLMEGLEIVARPSRAGSTTSGPTSTRASTSPSASWPPCPRSSR